MNHLQKIKGVNFIQTSRRLKCWAQRTKDGPTVRRVNILEITPSLTHQKTLRAANSRIDPGKRE